MDVPRLQRVYSMVTMIFFRNKNQHCKSIWWKWLALLRRTLSRTLYAVRIQKGEKTLLNLANLLHDYLIPKSFIAFSTVVADGQFSTLGTVLLAALAETKKAVVSVNRRDFVPQQEGDVRSKDNVNDVGELVQRELEEVDQPAPLMMRRAKAEVKKNLESPNEIPNGSTHNTPTRRSKTKRHSRSNAIDDLFDSLR